MPILDAAVNAHLAGVYALSVPTLLAQTDGLLAQFFARPVRGMGVNPKVKPRLGRLFKETDDYLGLDTAQHNYFIRVIVPNADTVAIPETLDRNLVLHGLDVSYASRRNSVKAILMFDLTQLTTVVVALPTSKVYHRTGCPAASHAEGLLMFTNLWDKGLDTRTPCRRCKPPSHA